MPMDTLLTIANVALDLFTITRRLLKKPPPDQEVEGIAHEYGSS